MMLVANQKVICLTQKYPLKYFILALSLNNTVEHDY